jgi:hypothetical protein
METPQDPASPRTADGKVDMSPEAIDQRLDMVSALYDLGKYLQTARPIDIGDQQKSDASVDETR